MTATVPGREGRGGKAARETLQCKYKGQPLNRRSISAIADPIRAGAVWQFTYAAAPNQVELSVCLDVARTSDTSTPAEQIMVQYHDPALEWQNTTSCPTSILSTTGSRMT